jgi:hypothetical protein
MSSTRIRRHLNAPRATVYCALLDPQAIAKWKVPEGMTCHVHEFDAREGGSFRISLTYDQSTVAPNGSTLDRLAILTIIRSPSYRLDHGARTEIVVRAVGEDAAVVRHHYQGAGSFEGASFTDDQRCVMVWEKQAGEWRLVMEQCSINGE